VLPTRLTALIRLLIVERADWRGGLIAERFLVFWMLGRGWQVPLARQFW